MMIIARFCWILLVVALGIITPDPSWAWRYGKTGGVSAPVLSAATASTDGNDHAFIGVTTDTGSGTLFYDGSTNCSANPNATQIKNGTTPGHVVNGSQSVSSSGAQSANPGSLSPVTAYCFYFVQTTSLDSNIVNSSSFTTNGTITFSPTFTTAWNANTNRVAFTAVANNVLSELAACFTPPLNITVSMTFDYQSIGGGAATSPLPANFFYAAGTPPLLRNVLIGLQGKNSIQTALFANPPANDPTGIGDLYWVSQAQERGLGFVFGASTDWTTTVDSVQAWDSTLTCSGSGDCLAQALEHEDTEGMGRVWGQSVSGSASLLEFSSYSSAGTRNVSSSGTRYPSSDGGSTNMIGPSCTYNNTGGGDLGDWTNCVDAFTQADSGAKPPMSAQDVKAMSAYGWLLSHTCRAQAP